MDVYENLGLKVQKIRRTKEWSQEELAFRSGLDRTYISHIENGKRAISLLAVCKIAKGLGVEPCDLLKGIHL
jgi:transcriptional regulator with XRE-family HTH domain